MESCGENLAVSVCLDLQRVCVSVLLSTCEWLSMCQLDVEGCVAAEHLWLHGSVMVRTCRCAYHCCEGEVWRHLDALNEKSDGPNPPLAWVQSSISRHIPKRHAPSGCHAAKYAQLSSSFILDSALTFIFFVLSKKQVNTLDKKKRENLTRSQNEKIRRRILPCLVICKAGRFALKTSEVISPPLTVCFHLF